MSTTYPNGFVWEQLWSGVPNPDKPLPNIAEFDRLQHSTDRGLIVHLNQWARSQETIEYIQRHHGPKGCGKVLRGIARASSKLQVPMSPRVRHYAEALDLTTY